MAFSSAISSGAPPLATARLYFLWFPQAATTMSMSLSWTCLRPRTLAMDWSCPSWAKVRMGLIWSMVPATAVTLPMRPPFWRYSRVSTEKKGKVFLMSWGTRFRVSSRQEAPPRRSSASWSMVIPTPREPLTES